MTCQLLLVSFEEHEHAEERIEPGIDRRQRLHGLEYKRAVVRGRMRVHVALVEPGLAFRNLGVGVLPRDLCLMLRPAGDGGKDEDEQQSGRPAESAVAPRLGGVLDRNGQGARKDHCLVVVPAEYCTSFAFSGSTPSPMFTTTRMPALRSACAP